MPEGAAADIGVGPGVVINVTTSNTAGSSSPALSGASVNGFVQIINDTATTQGDNSAAIRANAFDDVEITTAHVSTLGANSPASMQSSSNGDIVVNAGDISTAGIFSTASPPTPISTSPSSRPAASRPPETFRPASMPMPSSAASTSPRPGSPPPATSPTRSMRMARRSVTVTANGAISTTGAFSRGVYAYSYLSSVEGSRPARSPPRATSHAQWWPKAATGATVTANGPITTTGNNADGVFAYAATGNVSITTGNVTTGDNDANTPATGLGSDGIVGVADTGNVTITGGAISTFGDQAFGVVGISNDTTSVTVGSIITRGDNALGMYAYGREDIIVDAGSVSTAGANSTGILAIQGNLATPGGVADASITIDRGHGEHGGRQRVGVAAYSADGIVDIITGTVTTRGADSAGIVATGVGDVDIRNVQRRDPRREQPGHRGLFGPRLLTVVQTGAISTAGDNSAGVYAQAGGGHVSVTTNSVTTTGNNSAGVVAIQDNSLGGTPPPPPPPSPIGAPAVIGSAPAPPSTAARATPRATTAPPCRARPSTAGC